MLYTLNNVFEILIYFVILLCTVLILGVKTVCSCVTTC